jgi:ankyrin repeat protein
MAISYRAAQSVIKRGDELSLRKALEERLDPNLANQNGWSLLMLAAVEGDVPLGRLLLEHGADPSLRNNKDETALTLATHRGFTEFVKLLEDHGTTAQ